MARESGPGRVSIAGLVLDTDQAMWQASSYIPLQDLDVQLVNVNLFVRSSLVLSLRQWHVQFNAPWHETLSVLVPAGHEDEARQLAERLRTETIIANRRKKPPSEPQ